MLQYATSFTIRLLRRLVIAPTDSHTLDCATVVVRTATAKGHYCRRYNMDTVYWGSMHDDIQFRVPNFREDKLAPQGYAIGILSLFYSSDEHGRTPYRLTRPLAERRTGLPRVARETRTANHKELIPYTVDHGR